jgi:hypothetical protein
MAGPLSGHSVIAVSRVWACPGPFSMRCVVDKVAKILGFAPVLRCCPVSALYLVGRNSVIGIAIR